jgi:DNA-binding protein HU-beta
MNRAQLVDAVSQSADLPKATVEKALDAVFDAIRDELKKGSVIALSGFGTFKVSERAARSGRNPRTGETIEIKASKAPRFVAGKALKDALN